MPVTTRTRFASRAGNLHSSPLRDIFKAIDSPGIISFAGGLPSPESFPDLHANRIEPGYLQYGSSEGDLPLREHIAAKLTRDGLPTEAGRVIVLSGSQQGIDLVAKLFVDEQSNVAIESPTYLAALQVFDFFGANYKHFTPDDIKAAFQGASPSLLYTVPTFQNPTGHVYSRAEREELAQHCDTHGTVLFEDDPYRDLVYDSCDRTPVCSQLQSADWVYQSSFSKSVAPGLRIGFLTCSEALYPKLLHLKQAADLHSCRVSQSLLLNLLQSQDIDVRCQVLSDEYRIKRDRFHDTLNATLSHLATWQKPAGGLFFWLTLNRNCPIDANSVLNDAIAQGVAFMPGVHFFADKTQACNAIRLNFSNADIENYERGISTIAGLLEEGHRHSA